MSDDLIARGHWSRRRFVSVLAGATASASVWARTARADDPPRLVRVPHLAFGAVVAAVAGDDVTIEIDPSLPVAKFGLGDVELSVAAGLLLKGEGLARPRYLDDARNAPKLGAAVRDHLRSAWPDLADGFTRRHRTWSRSLVRDVLRLTQQLQRAGLRGKRVRDPYGRIYLLEWAGATVADDGVDPPAGLRDAPAEPASATPPAYRDYVQALVDATR